MFKFNAREFLNLSTLLREMEVTLERFLKNKDELVDEKYKEWLTERLDVLIQGCAGMGLELSIRLIETIKKSISVPTYRISTFVADLKELQRRIDHEISSPLFLVVPRSKTDYFEQPELFGSNVATKFTTAGYDIQEAGNCFATARNTASVMHLMRSLEVALDAIGLGVGLSNAAIEAHSSWERLLTKISKQIEINDNASNPSWSLKRQFFVDAHAHLFAVKNAWRNPSMHLEKKYEDREAERIFRAVQDFMEYLATHLDESGTYTQ